MLITIDGPAGSGKSTVAKRLAQQLGFFYLDTGATYRVLGLAVYRLTGKEDNFSEAEVLEILNRIEITVENRKGEFKIYLNGEDVSDLIRDEKVGRLASLVARFPAVKERLFELQRKLVNNGNAVVEGRDAGLYVFPDADVKIFLTASPEERAKRRYEQLKSAGVEVSFEEILRAIVERDKRDATRERYPFKPAEDANIIDTTGLGLEEVYDKVFSIVKPFLNVLITGVGSGLGLALAREFLNRGYKVYALSRHFPQELTDNRGFHAVYCDLENLEEIYCRVKGIAELVDDKLPWVILNAGVLGRLKEMRKTHLAEIERVMRVNLWSNKLILDALIDALSEEAITNVGQIIAISSGAAVNCNKGWNAYSLSKAALNCEIKLYSHEFEKSHLIALAPGLILTPMLEKLLREGDEERFPSLKRLKAAPKHTPESATKMLFEVFPNLLKFPSGSFVDVRTAFPDIYESFLPKSSNP